MGSERALTVNVSGGDVSEYIVSGLVPSTVYSTKVAALNSAGTGPYTSLLMIESPAEGIYQCKINDSTDTVWKLHVGLYNNGTGKKSWEH